MSEPKTVAVTPAVHAYMVAHSMALDDVQRRLIQRTRELGPVAGMQIAPEQGAFMTLLTRLIGARRAVEVGTFTGYSALAIARGLPPDGHLLCCDVSEEWTAIARDAWRDAGVEGRIELRLAPAIDTLSSLPRDEMIDLAFIDADKPSYAAYYEELLARLRPNGLILIDNVLWSGAVADLAVHDENTEALRAFNDMVAGDQRVEVAMLPIADGLSLVRKR